MFTLFLSFWIFLIYGNSVAIFERLMGGSFASKVILLQQYSVLYDIDFLVYAMLFLIGLSECLLVDRGRIT